MRRAVRCAARLGAARILWSRFFAWAMVGANLPIQVRENVVEII